MLTLKDFRSVEQQILKQAFRPTATHPAEYALERARFRREQLKRLLELGASSPLETVRRKMASYRRQMARLDEVATRFEPLPKACPEQVKSIKAVLVTAESTKREPTTRRDSLR